MRDRGFRLAMAAARTFGESMAASVTGEIRFEPFGTTDRPRCLAERAAFCGVKLYFPGRQDPLEVWYCRDHQGVYAGSVIEDAAPFPYRPDRAERERHKLEIERFGQDVVASLGTPRRPRLAK